MSIQQGLISPPLSGRTYKTDQPRISDIHKVVNAVDVFGRPAASSTTHNAQQPHFEHRQHTIHSPVKKHELDLSDAERAARPLTPPMSKDVRHDEQQQPCHAEDSNAHQRIDSDGDHHYVQSSSSSSFGAGPSTEVRVAQPSTYAASASKTGLMAAANVTSRFDTLNQGVTGFESDDEHNPFLDRRSSGASKAAAASASAAPAHHSHPYYDEFDSDQDAEGSEHEDTVEYIHPAPRASTSSNYAVDTTPPNAFRRPTGYRPARPFSTRVQVANEPVTTTVPIRDTPKNPFLAGGPADNGFQGPNGHIAARRARQIPGKERGKITYVFRGQRVTYADPEYDSDDDDSDPGDQRARTNEFNPHHNPEQRPPRLQPKLLFPPNIPASSYVSKSSSSRSAVPKQQQHGVASSGSSSSSSSSSNRRGNAGGSYLPRADFADDEFASGSGRPHEGRDLRIGGGLFAAQIAAQRKQNMVPAVATSRAHVDHYDFLEEEDEVAPVSRHHHAAAVAPSSSARLQSVTHGSNSRQTAREALLARLDQTNWSDDEEDSSYERERSRRVVEDEEDHQEEEEERYNAVQSHHMLARSQSQRKRLSDELQPGHEEEVDAVGRPYKRARSSYAF